MGASEKRWKTSKAKSSAASCLQYSFPNFPKLCCAFFFFIPRHRPSIRIDRVIQVGVAREGQLFGLKIEHLNLWKFVSHSFYTVTKVGALPNNTNSTIIFNLILLRHRGQLFFNSKVGALPNNTNSTFLVNMILLRHRGQ